MGALQRHEATPGLTLADVELHALADLVAQPFERGPGDLGEGKLGTGGARERDEAQTEREATTVVAPHQPVRLEGDGQPVRRRSRQAGGRGEVGERERAIGFEGSEHRNALVEDADTA